MGYVGLRSGLPAELLKLFAVLGGFFLSFSLYGQIGLFLASVSFLSLPWAEALSLITLVVLLYLGLTRLGRLLEPFIKVAFNERINSVGGLVLGLIRGGLVASILLVILLELPSNYLERLIRGRSLTGKSVSEIAPTVYDGLLEVPRWIVDKIEPLEK